MACEWDLYMYPDWTAPESGVNATDPLKSKVEMLLPMQAHSWRVKLGTQQHLSIGIGPPGLNFQSISTPLTPPNPIGRYSFFCLNEICLRYHHLVSRFKVCICIQINTCVISVMDWANGPIAPESQLVIISSHW